jgi:ATP-dependent RNA helicase DeaD
LYVIVKSELRKISSIEESSNKIRRKTIPSGIEICEIQLLHLATKIEVDHEIDNYLPAINSVLEDLSKEELIKNQVEFNRFINTTRKLETSLINLQVLKDVNVMIEMVLKRKQQMVVQQDIL